MPAGRVHQNRWHDLAVPELGAWTPTATVSVVVPAHQAHAELALTLAALGEQTYPHELLQIVVVDDGSDPPLLAPKQVGGADVVVVRQENTGFGAGRARNAGAEAADGEILVFLDADIVAHPGHVEAHARWHHQVDYAATLAFRTFVDFAGIDADAVRKAVRGAGLDELLSDRRQDPHQWIEDHLERTDDLREPRPDPWRIVVGAGAAVRADFFAEAGGYPTFGIRGTEDTVFGYRLYTHGALIVPDRDAHSWHQGPRSLDDVAAKELILAARRPTMANHLPVPGFRPTHAGRSYVVPAMTVEVVVDGASEDEIVACLDAILANRFHDLVVGVVGPFDRPLHERLARWYEDDLRVRFVEDKDWARQYPHTPFRVRIPPSVVVASNTLGLIHARLESHEIGALHITVPGEPTTTMIEAATTRALRRAERVAGPGEELAAVIGELFGEAWAAGEDFNLGVEVGAAEGAAGAGRYAGWSQEELVARLARVEEQLASLRRRRIVAFLNAVGALRRARSGGQVLAALRAMASAVTRPR